MGLEERAWFVHTIYKLTAHMHVCVMCMCVIRETVCGAGHCSHCGLLQVGCSHRRPLSSEEAQKDFGVSGAEAHMHLCITD